MVTDFKLEQPQNTLISRLSRELGMLTEVRLEQFENASLPILVTLLGIVIEAKLEQPVYLQLVVSQFVMI